MKNNTLYVPVIFIGIALSALLLAGFACKPEPKEKTYLIGYVNPSPAEKEGAHGFLRNMPKFGYSEGRNLTYIRCESKDKKVIESALRDMVAKKADLIFTITTPATKMAQQITKGTNIPVVFVVYEAVESGLIESLVHPGGNLTGVQLSGSTPKTLDWLLAIAPDTQNIFVPISFDTGAANKSLEALKRTAEMYRIKLTISEVSTVEALRASLASMPEDIDAIFILHSILIGSNIETILETAKKRKVLLASSGHEHHKSGAVFSYGPTDERTGWQAARLAHSILHGANPADLPAETSDFYLGFNLKTAEAIGLEIPNDILQQTDDIVR
ncbi:MAG: ABC transporter substrate-binding protein [Nitrospirota bacterium]|nr:ABC transporter substrate-binding protein [Nitrospirota bacterium]